MKILHVLPSLQQNYGGPIRAVLDLSAQSESHGLQSEVLGFGELNVPDNPLRVELIHCLQVSFPKQYCFSSSINPWLRSNLSRFDGVVLHGMWLYPNFAVAAACNRLGIPYACFPHGMLEPWAVFHQTRWKAAKKWVYWHLREKQIHAGARCLFFTTEREKTLAGEAFHLGTTRRILIPYGAADVEESVTQPSSEKLLQPASRKVALFLGRLHPKKNITFLLDVWKEACPPSDWHLVIAGSGDEAYTQELHRRIDQGNLRSNVHMVGFVTGRDKSYLLQRAKWFLLPSLQENFGIAVVEAMNHGCPIVVSDQVFVSDSMHPESEVLALNKDIWVRFVRQRMVDEGRRLKLAALEKSHATATFGLEKVSREWSATLQETFRG